MKVCFLQYGISMTEVKKLGKYRLIHKIGHGGMGEVYLAEDPLCERLVALKKIVPKLSTYQSIRNRFLREAKIASQFSHPSIMPIYSIHQEDNELYYTMPYIKGKTLKEIFTQAQLTKTEPPLSTQVQTYLKVCQAIAYTHAKGYLHRDIKPDNIIIGRFNEVLILDWGIAISIEQSKEEIVEDVPTTTSDLTAAGKVVGTISYMDPERAQGKPSSKSTDIYSLGVLLYHILTLRLPFIRPSLKEFQRRYKHEKLMDPEEIAPYRDIPKQLSQIAKTCLAPCPKDRYTSVDELIMELENYIEGVPVWNKTSQLQISCKKDWEFQENILLTKHTALSRVTEVMEWVMLMVSKEPYSGNIKLETTITLKAYSSGIGFLLGIPESSERKSVEDGYCLWIGPDGCKLYIANVELLSLSEVSLQPNQTYVISIEKVDKDFNFAINAKKVLSYNTHIPIIGAHIGLLYKDAHFDMDPLNIYLGAHNVMVKCLSIPDAFFNRRDFDNALVEYRRIAHSFPGRSEGREALFRAGITLIENGEKTHNTTFFELALDEFEKLHQTPEAPLEYLGKSLVYKAGHDIDEEVKCLELALRKYKEHPLIEIIENHIDYRLHETSKQDRIGAYHFTLLVIRQLPHLLERSDCKKLVETLTKHWEPLYFLNASKNQDSLPIYHSIVLAFWLSKPITLIEIYNSLPKNIPDLRLLIENIHFALLVIGYKDEANKIQSSPSDDRFERYQFEKGIIRQTTLPMQRIWALLYSNKLDLAGELLKKANSKDPLFHLLYGIYLLGREGPEICHIHFQQPPKKNPTPTHLLLGQYLQGNISFEGPWKPFAWERLQLYRQLSLYHKVAGNLENSLKYEQLISSSNSTNHLLPTV